ncbi:MAG: PDZ domain-containing protein [Bacteroidota bacterium]|nr:PDZ domain-containing protein [Bacteroidota bacterium]
MIKTLFSLTIFTIMSNAQPSITYTLSMSKPQTHLLEVEITLRDFSSKTVAFHMPAWRTGRYMIFDFSGGVQEFNAVDENNRTLLFKKNDKDTWLIEKEKSKIVTVRYKVYANEFNQRTRELNNEHAFVDPLSVFMYVEELKNKPIEVKVIPFGNWKVTTGLDEVADKPFTFTAPNFEYFGDCPLEIGTQKDFEFFVDGKKHIISIYGEGNWNIDTLIADFTKIVIANKELWGDLPYNKYIFMIHCQPNAGGGTEHINSTIMGVRPFIFSNPVSYKGFIGLVSHEYFHTWNVKQLRPKAFAPYDFSKESYTEELWVSEGTTSYYDDLILVRTKFSTAKSYLENVSQMVNNERLRYGNNIQPLVESSFDSWIKYWRGKQNSQNAESDYYGKGSQVSLLLDLEIRQRSKNKFSFDDVLRTMYKRFPYTKGFTNADIQKVCEEFAGSNLKEIFDSFLLSTNPLPWEKVLSYAGLELIAKDSTKKINLGISLQDFGEKTRVTNVTPHSPAEKAELDINDEIVALNSFRVRSSDFNDRIASMKEGEEVRITVFRNDKLKEIKLKLEYFGSPSFTVKKVDKPTELQQKIYEDWLGEHWN